MIYKVGDEVEITHGLFNGIIGVIIKTETMPEEHTMCTIYVEEMNQNLNFLEVFIKLPMKKKLDVLINEKETKKLERN